MFQLLKMAQTDFEKAYSIAPSDPHSASNMVTVSLLKKYPREVMDKWFNKAVEADDLWIEPYQTKLNYIMPMWYGSANEVKEFYKNCFEKSPKGSVLYSIIFDYLKGAVNIHGFIADANLYPNGSLSPETLAMTTEGIKRFRNDFPNSTLPDYYEGLLSHSKNDFESAINFYEKVLTKKQNDTKSIEAKIVAMLQLGQREKAETELNKLLQIDPVSAFAQANIGSVQIMLHNNIDKGIEFF